MLVTDPIADMLSRIRNALVARHDVVVIPASNMKKSIARIMLSEGFIRSFDVLHDSPQGSIRIILKYTPDKKSVITGLKRISRPGLRVYTGRDDVPRVLGGLGLAILSTPKGVMTDKDARKAAIGGEVLAYIW
jgi:small subunit ribosomal protein S8